MLFLKEDDRTTEVRFAKEEDGRTTDTLAETARPRSNTTVPDGPIPVHPPQVWRAHGLELSMVYTLS